MLHSIQDYAKRINSKLTWMDVVSVLITMLFLLGFSVFLYLDQHRNSQSVTYIPGNPAIVAGDSADSRPFASAKGKTYTFAWCNGSGNISSKNKIYFPTETAALASGRTLSKLCTK